MCSFGSSTDETVAGCDLLTVLLCSRHHAVAVCLRADSAMTRNQTTP